MSLKKHADGLWLVDIRPAGTTGKRIRKRFTSKPEALRFEAWCTNQATQGKPWNPAQTDRRTLSTLIERWDQLHGHTLKDSKKRLARLQAIDAAMKYPLASDVDAKKYTSHRAQRLTTDEVTITTVNHELAFLKAVFNELERAGEWTSGNPLAQVRPLKMDEPAMAWLTLDQIRALLAVLRTGDSPDAYLITRICLQTGARWGEAEELTTGQIRDGRITFNYTKSGKNRSVPYADAELDEFIKGKSGRLFRPCVWWFRKAIEKAGLDLPKGQLTHVCRHTFGSHYMANGGDILTLQRILGHASLTMTMRYAHFSPGHLADAPTRSPLAFL